jgi:signal transduction histidine kinase
VESAQTSPKHRWKAVAASPLFWISAAALIAITALHYLSPQTRTLFPRLNAFLNRHAVERILFILPVAAASLAFRSRGGLVALALVVAMMIPRALWLSPQPADALIETAAVAIVGCFVIWLIASQGREKTLVQKAVSRLEAISAISAIVTESLELHQILNSVLEKVLEVTDTEAGLIFLLDPPSQELALVAYRGVAEESVTDLDRLKLGEGFCGRVAQLGELLVVQDSSQDPRLTRLAVQQEGLRTQVITPLKSKDQVQGVLAVATRRVRQFLPDDLELIAAIGNQIGVAVENARLYENLRFYVHEITRAQENERKRIARELHDETIQMLIFISRRLEVLATLPEQSPETIMPLLESLRESVRDTLKDLRRFVQDLRPPTLDHLGLVAALEGLTNGLVDKDGVKTELSVTGPVQRLVPEDRELVLFRIAQEALNNVRRHSGASRATVQVEFSPAKVRMTIEDNGHGFDAPERMSDLVSAGKLGLVGMHERARTLGGTLTVRSRSDSGTVVVVDVPLQPYPEGASSKAQQVLSD